MAYVISDACLSCGSCEGECPVGAIAQGDGKYEISVLSVVLARRLVRLARFLKADRAR